MTEQNKFKCDTCRDTGVWETGNNDMVCPCPAGEKIADSFYEWNSKRWTKDKLGQWVEEKSNAPEKIVNLDQDWKKLYHQQVEINRLLLQMIDKLVTNAKCDELTDLVTKLKKDSLQYLVQ